jgi:hypothetical protein
MKKLGKAVGAIAIAGAIAAGGAAFTNSNTIAPLQGETAGYSTTTVSGVTATSVVYGLNAVGDTITSLNLVLDGDTTTDDIAFAFNGDNLTACSDAGTYDGVGDETTYACTANQNVVLATALHISAVNQ